ncbi:MAG: hypothetical protein ACREA9_04705, partial [Pyrinomonadaceae bacterium]
SKAASRRACRRTPNLFFSSLLGNGRPTADSRRMTALPRSGMTYKFQKLEIYQLALDYVGLVYELA